MKVQENSAAYLAQTISDGWCEKPLRDLLTKLVDGSHNPPPKQDSGLPMLSARNIENNNIVFDEYRLITEGAFKTENARTRITAGDVLLTIVGTIGRAAVVPETAGLFALQRSVAVLTPGPELLPKFLVYQLQSPGIQRYFEAKARGTAQKGVYLKTLGQTPVQVAPLDQQKRTVAEIEKQFSRLDEAVANLKRVKANLKRYKAAVLKAAVEGHLVETEAELARREGGSYETGAQLLQRILETRRSQWQGKGKYKEPAAPDTTDLPELPEGWAWASPDQLAEFADNSICAGPFGTIFKAKDFRPSGIPIIFLRHVAPGRYLNHKPGFMDVKKWQELFQPYSVYGGELLITKLGEPPGVCAIYPEGIGPAMVTPDVIKLSVNADVVLPRYLMHYFNSETARRFSTGVAFGTTRLRLTIPIFRRMPIPLPSFKEQQDIVTEIERSYSLADKADAQVNANLLRAKQLRSSILANAFLIGKGF
jgi:type I restriction enzyme, S subunit